MDDLTNLVKSEALRLGFQAVGITGISSLQARSPELGRWLSSGFAGPLKYMHAFFERQHDFLTHLPNFKSIVVLAVSYNSEKPLSSSTSFMSGVGLIARYAHGREYHRAIKKRLRQFIRSIQASVKEPFQSAWSIDTAPVQERVLAEMAGVGFFGKNTCLIMPRGGSFFFLAALLTTLKLTPDEPVQWDCGSCSLCLDACPTHALVRPYELDANRCISSLTIEMRGPIDSELRSQVRNWIFGCDICQEVCPYNRKSITAHWSEFSPKVGAGSQLSIAEVLQIRTEEMFQRKFRGTPLMRAKRDGLLRNAAVAAGNLGDPQLVQSLSKALLEDSSPIIRQHAAWALGKIFGRQATESLSKALLEEKVPSVTDEIRLALNQYQSL